LTAILKNYGTSDRELTSSEAGYLAGFLDGEGCLTIGRARREGYRSGWTYVALMMVSNTDLAGLECIAEMSGNGKIQLQDKRGKPTHKTLYRLIFGAKQIRHLLPQVQPHLLIKRRQAELLMAFLDLKESGQYRTDEYWRECERLRAEIRGLNVRGLKDASADAVVLSPRRFRQGSPCSVAGCGASRYGQGYCYQHYYARVIKPKNDADKAERGQRIICAICGTGFISRRSKPSSVCSKRCRGKLRYRQNPERHKALVAANKARKRAEPAE
jgi:hypothetical protein